AVTGYRARTVDGELARARGVLEAAGVTVTTTGAVSGLPRDVDDLLAWVVREATTNIVRHSRARRAGFALTERDGSVRLEVDNDGVASGPADADPGEPVGGSGLVGLRERVAAAGGQLTAASLDDGFRVIAAVPVGAPALAAPAAHLL